MACRISVAAGYIGTDGRLPDGSKPVRPAGEIKGAIRLNEFADFLKSKHVRSIKKISYLNLVAFVADFNALSIHVRKSHVWTLRQFYHFLTLHPKEDVSIRT